MKLVNKPVITRSLRTLLTAETSKQASHNMKSLNTSYCTLLRTMKYKVMGHLAILITWKLLFATTENSFVQKALCETQEILSRFFLLSSLSHSPSSLCLESSKSYLLFCQTTSDFCPFELLQPSFKHYYLNN